MFSGSKTGGNANIVCSWPICNKLYQQGKYTYNQKSNSYLFQKRFCALFVVKLKFTHYFLSMNPPWKNIWSGKFLPIQTRSMEIFHFFCLWKNSAYGQNSSLLYVCDLEVPILYHKSMSIPWVYVYTMSPCLVHTMSPYIYHESTSIPWVNIYTVSPCLYHDFMSISWVPKTHCKLAHKSQSQNCATFTSPIWSLLWIN